MSSFLSPESRPVSKRVNDLRFSPDHKNLAIRDGDNNVWQYDLKSRSAKLAPRTTNDNRRLQDLAYSADGQHLYAIGERGTPSWVCWTAKDLELASTSNSVEGRHLERTLSGDLMINGRDVLNLSSPIAVPKIRKRSGLIRSHEGSVTLLMSNLSGLGGESSLDWKDQADEVTTHIPTPKLNARWQQFLQRHVGRAVGRQSSVGGSLMLSPCGNRVVLLDRRELMLWDAATNESWQLLGPDEDAPHHLPLSADILTARFSPNGQWLVIGTVGRSAPDPIAGEVHLIDMVAGRRVGQITVTTQSVSALDFSDDQRWLAVGSTSLVDDRVRVFDLDAWFSAGQSNSDASALPVQLDELAVADSCLAMFRSNQIRQQPEAYREQLVSTLTFNASRAQQLMGQVIKKMDSPAYGDRAHAESELQRLAEHYPTTLRELLDDATLSSESRFRIQRTIASMTGAARMSPEEWRVLCRSMHALEGVGEAWAEQLLADTCRHPVRFVARQARLSHEVWRSRHQAL
ncbi:MAG: hypothetical protein JNK57_00935 [Planctomycetaceae bacterium]|nr:hypothetical protein [Planctomycetaceae bacterium]